MAAVHYVLADAFDRDPFLLFKLRGRDKEAVLAALRRLRSASTDEESARRRARIRPAGTISIRSIRSEDYERAVETAESIHFHIGEPPVPGALLRQLGAPPSWRLDATPYDLLHPAVSRAAALARELALGADAEPPPDPSDPTRSP